MMEIANASIKRTTRFLWGPLVFWDTSQAC
jgi:hypothetical protein